MGILTNMKKTFPVHLTRMPQSNLKFWKVIINLI